MKISFVLGHISRLLSASFIVASKLIDSLWGSTLFGLIHLSTESSYKAEFLISDPEWNELSKYEISFHKEVAVVRIADNNLIL